MTDEVLKKNAEKREVIAVVATILGALTGNPSLARSADSFAADYLPKNRQEERAAIQNMATATVFSIAPVPIAVPGGRLVSVLQQKLRNDLARSATAAADDGVLAITRAIQKHSAREVTAFSPVTGNLAARNAAGRALADDILGNPATTFTQRTTGRFGEVLDVVAPDGRGLRFGSDGQFIGLLEPPL
jgi:hypothetical protein